MPGSPSAPTITSLLPIHDCDHAVLFADIVGSSDLYQQLGNSLAQREIDRLMSMMIQVIQAHGGQLVKTIGDEIMVIFSDPECAAESAIALNLKIQEQNRAIRTGMAYGALIFDGTDAFGDTVNRAASLVSAAHSKQILVDQALYEQMPYWLLNYCDLYDRLRHKGSEHRALVYRLNWQAEGCEDLEVTHVNDSLVSSQTSFAREIELTINNETFPFCSSDKPFTIGRDPSIVQCVISGPKISRLHCIISFSRGKFIFEDRSTNGSYIQEAEQPQLYLRRESAPLVRGGKIVLGQQQSIEHNVISFRHL